jgi:hypothetical protein
MVVTSDWECLPRGIFLGVLPLAECALLDAIIRVSKDVLVGLVMC